MARLAALRHPWTLLFAFVIASPVFAQETVTISGTITTAADGVPVKGAVIALAVSTPAITATSGEDGKYALVVPRALVRYGRVQIRVDALGLPTKTVGVAIDGATARAEVALTIGFAEQIVVGSRTPGADAERAVPVDVLTHEQIAASGFTETAQVIASLAPSFNFPRPSITDGTERCAPPAARPGPSVLVLPMASAATMRRSPERRIGRIHGWT